MKSDKKIKIWNAFISVGPKNQHDILMPQTSIIFRRHESSHSFCCSKCSQFMILIPEFFWRTLPVWSLIVSLNYNYQHKLPSSDEVHYQRWLKQCLHCFRWRNKSEILVGHAETAASKQVWIYSFFQGHYRGRHQLLNMTPPFFSSRSASFETGNSRK